MRDCVVHIKWAVIVLIVVLGILGITSIVSNYKANLYKSYTEQGLVKFKLRVPLSYTDRVIWIKPEDVEMYARMNTHTLKNEAEGK